MRVTMTDRPYGEYDFYSVSPENFGYHLVSYCNLITYLYGCCAVFLCHIMETVSHPHR